jgi:hypothetical protein
MFSEWVNQISKETGKSLPVTLALFGGYRSDNYDAVLDLHLKSLLICANIICKNEQQETLTIPRKVGR